MMDTLNRLMRHLKPMFKMLLNERGEVDAGAGAGGDGGQAGAGAGAGTIEAPEWVKSLPAEAHKDPEIIKYKTPDEFYKGYRSKVEMLGKKGVLLPKDESPEERERFYNESGRPKTPEEYKFTDVKDVHPKVGNAAELSKGLAPVFHKLGLRNDQADAANQEFLNLLSAAAADQEAKQTAVMQATEAQLRKDWGGNYDGNKNRIGQVIAQMTSEEERKALGGVDGFGNNSVFLKIVNNLVSKMSEDTIKNLGAGTQTGNTGEMTPAQAEAKKKEMEDQSTDLYKALMNERHPKHEEAVELRTKIYKVLHGGGSST